MIFRQFAASIPPIVYSLLGTSRQLNVASEAALSLLVGQAVTEFRRSYPTNGDLVSRDKVGFAVATAIGLQVRFFSNNTQYLTYANTRLDYSPFFWVSFASDFWTLSLVVPFSAVSSLPLQ